VASTITTRPPITTDRNIDGKNNIRFGQKGTSCDNEDWNYLANYWAQ
jgi:hypothetical protein